MIPSASLLLFPLLLLLLSSFPSISSTDWDNLGATPNGIWLANFPAPTPISNQFCLSPPLRSISNYSAPLYPQSVYLGFPSQNTFDTIWCVIVKILIQEVIGYEVIITDPVDAQSLTTNDWVLDFYDPVAPADFIPNTGFASSNFVPFNNLYNQYINVDRSIISFGPHSADPERGGIFFPTRLVKESLYSLFDWTTYSKGIQTHGYDIPWSPERDAMVNSVISIFINDSWAGYNSNTMYNVPGQPQYGVVCPPDEYFFPSLHLTVGCNDNNYPSIYIPPQCYPNPREQCALIWSYTPFVSTGVIGPLVRELNLSLAVAYLNLDFIMTYPPDTDQNILLLSGTSESAGLQNCVQTDGTTTRCMSPLRFPVFGSSCLPIYTGNYTAPYVCDFPPLTDYRMAKASLATTAPRIFDFLSQATYQNSDIQFFYDQTTAANVPRPDLKQIACNWLQANEDRWTEWIDPPAPCTLTDYTWTISDCDPDNAVRYVEYEWIQPKSCQNGISLPSPSSVTCEFFDPQCSHSQAMDVVSSSVAILAIFIIFFTLPLLSVNYSSALAQSIESRITYSKTVSNKKSLTETSNSVTPYPSSAPSLSPSSSSALPLSSSLSKDEFTWTQTLVATRLRYPLSLSIVSLMGVWLPILSIGILFLCASQFIHFNYGELSNAFCWIDFSLLIYGITLINLCICVSSIKFHRISNKMMMGNKLEKRLYYGAFFVMLVCAIILVIDGSQTNILGHSVITLNALATLPLQRCGTFDDWLIIVFFVINGFSMLISFLLIFRMTINHFSVWLLNEYGGQRRNSRVMENAPSSKDALLTLFSSSSSPSSPVANSPSTSWGNRRFKLIGKGHSTQLKSLLFCFFVTIALTAIVLSLVNTDSNTMTTDSYQYFDLYSRYCMMILIYILWITLFTLSIWDVYRIRRRERRGKEKEERRKRRAQAMTDGGSSRGNGNGNGQSDNEDRKSKKSGSTGTANRNNNNNDKNGGRNSLLGFFRRGSKANDNDMENDNSIESPTVDSGGVGTNSKEKKGAPSPKNRHSSLHPSVNTSTSSSSSRNPYDDDDGNELDSLRNVISDPLCSLLLEQYAESTFDSESIKFLISCKKFLAMCSKSFLYSMGMQSDNNNQNNGNGQNNNGQNAIHTQQESMIISSMGMGGGSYHNTVNTNNPANTQIASLIPMLSAIMAAPSPTTPYAHNHNIADQMMNSSPSSPAARLPTSMQTIPNAIFKIQQPAISTPTTPVAQSSPSPPSSSPSVPNGFFASLLSTSPTLRSCLLIYATAESIYDNYIVEGGLHQLNVSGQQRIEMQNGVKKLKSLIQISLNNAMTQYQQQQQSQPQYSQNHQQHSLNNHHSNGAMSMNTSPISVIPPQSGPDRSALDEKGVADPQEGNDTPIPAVGGATQSSPSFTTQVPQSPSGQQDSRNNYQYAINKNNIQNNNNNTADTNANNTANANSMSVSNNSLGGPSNPFINQSSSTPSKISIPLSLNYSEYCALARQIFHSVIPEIYNLLSVNTYSRFLQSDFASRCNELILWSYEFSNMTEREQEAMLKRLQNQFKMQRIMREHEDSTVANSQQRGTSTKLKMNQAENQLLMNNMGMNNVSPSIGGRAMGGVEGGNRVSSFVQNQNNYQNLKDEKGDSRHFGNMRNHQDSPQLGPSMDGDNDDGNGNGNGSVAVEMGNMMLPGGVEGNGEEGK